MIPKNSFAIFSNAAKDGKYQNYGKPLISLLLVLVLTAFCTRSSSVGFFHGTSGLDIFILLFIRTIKTCETILKFDENEALQERTVV